MKDSSRNLTRKLIIYILFVFAAAAAFFSAYTCANASSLIIEQNYPNTDTEIKLEWTPVDKAVVYQIFRGEGASNASIATLSVDQSANFTSYVDRGSSGLGLDPDTAYTYTLRAYSDTQMLNEVWSQTAVCTTSHMREPKIVSSKYNINTKEVTVNWINNSKAAHSTRIVRYGTDAAVASLNTTGTSITFKDDSLAAAPVQYAAVSENIGKVCSSGPSSPMTVTPYAPPAMSAVMKDGVAKITWGSFEPVEQFNLERSKYNVSSGTWGEWLVVNSQLGYGMTGADNTPAAGGLYRYRLNAKADGSYAGYVMTQPASKPSAPVNLSAALISNNQVNLTWDLNTDNYSKLKVERKTGSGAYTVLATIDEFERTYSDVTAFSANTTYTYRITAYESDTSYSTSNEAVISTSVASAPTTLTLVRETASARLSWTDNSISESGFCIQRRDGTDEFVDLDSNIGRNVTSYIDSSLKAGHTYAYRVYAKSPFGNSVFSNEVVTHADIPIIAPSSLTVTVASATQLDLSWTYLGTGSYSTVIERKSGPDGEWKVIYTTAAGAIKYSDTNLSANTQYFYRVRNAIGAGVYSLPYPNNESGIGANTMLSGLSLSGSSVSGSRIQLSWSGVTGNADVIVERKMPGGSFAVMATLPYSAVSWTDMSGLVQGAVYYYRIKAKNPSNESVYSNEITVINVYLEAPSNLIATAGEDKKIELTWDDNSSDETGFEIWRYLYGSGTYQLYATVDMNSKQYTDTNVIPGVQYNYMIRAVRIQGNIYSSYTMSAGAGIGLLPPPTNLRYTVVSSSQVILQWNDNTNNESGFRIERKLPEEKIWTHVSWVNPNVTFYNINDITPYVKYIYRVRVYTYAGNFDAFSNEIEVTTGLPAKPTKIKAEAVSASQINISWCDNANNESGYRIERSIERSTVVFIAQVGANITKYQDKDLTPNVTYVYKVFAVNNNGSVQGDEVKAATFSRAAFTDVGSSMAWAKDAIENLAGRGVLQGKTASHFNPNDKITRAEFTAIMIRAFNLDKSTPTGSMTDVRIGKWYYREVMIAENLGIVSRDAKGRFYPDRPITREEIASIIVKTLTVVNKPLAGYGNEVLEKFVDKGLISPSALSSVASVVGDGIMSGRTAVSIAPKGSATRAEAAVFLYRVIDR